MKLKPEILCQPNIPKPLHGINPRTIRGVDWWNITRQKVYVSTDYHCVACGVAKVDAKVHQWLEAHELWNIDYTTGICEVISIEPLCHYCHNFIHSGRLQMIMDKEKSEEEVKDILEHGLNILYQNKLKCFPSTLKFAKELGCKTHGVKAYKIKVNPKIKWEDWKMVFEGKEYKSKFNSIDEWNEFFS